MRVSNGMLAADMTLVPDPPPVAWMFDTMMRMISANTQVPMAK